MQQAQRRDTRPFIIAARAFMTHSAGPHQVCDGSDNTREDAAAAERCSLCMREIRVGFVMPENPGRVAILIDDPRARVARLIGIAAAMIAAAMLMLMLTPAQRAEALSPAS